MKVLIVEEDIAIAKPLKEELEKQQLVVDITDDGETAWQMHQSEQYDLVLVDWMLPKLDGIELCRRMREDGYTGGILILTAKGEKNERIYGLDAGADDYIVKPFDIDELGARVRALLRRGKNLKTSWTMGNLTVNARSCVVMYGENKVELTPTEYRLIMHFLRAPDVTFNKRDLLESLWPSNESPTEAVIKTHIKGLRQKLAAAGAKHDLIRTVYGFGYRLNVEFE